MSFEKTTFVDTVPVRKYEVQNQLIAFSFFEICYSTVPYYAFVSSEPYQYSNVLCGTIDEIVNTCNCDVFLFSIYRYCTVVELSDEAIVWVFSVRYCVTRTVVG